jgi:hypothetical protein
MPRLAVRKATEVPTPSRVSRAVREQQEIYEGFIREINSNVGELELRTDEQPRSVKVRLRRAATRLGRELEIWDANGKVYFKATTKRGRPPASSDRCQNSGQCAATTWYKRLPSG